MNWEEVVWESTLFGCIVGEYTINPDSKNTYHFKIWNRKTVVIGPGRRWDMLADTRYEFTILVHGGRDNAEEAKEGMMAEGQREHDLLTKKVDDMFERQHANFIRAKEQLTYGPDEMSYAEYLKQQEKDDDEKNE